MPDECSTSWMGVLRNYDPAPAVLLWETVPVIRSYPEGLPSFDPIADRLRKRGFRGATDSLDELMAPVVNGWSLRRLSHQMLLSDPLGHVDEFDDANPVDPPGWIQAAEDTRRVLVVYGSGFGMDRLSPARINRVLQAGDALCALVPYQR